MKEQASGPAIELRGPPPSGPEQPPFPVWTVDRVAHDRVAERPEVNSDLVGAASMQANGKKVRRPPTLETSKVGQRWPPRFNDRHPLSVLRIARDRTVDGELVSRHVSPGSGQVAAPDFAARDSACQKSVSIVRPGNDHESTGVFIQPVDDPWAIGLADGGKGSETMKQGVHERAAPMSRRRVHHHAGPFVHHGKVVIFVHYLDVNRLGRDRCGRGGWHRHFHFVSRAKTPALPGRRTVDPHESPIEKRCDAVVAQR